MEYFMMFVGGSMVAFAGAVLGLAYSHMKTQQRAHEEALKAQTEALNRRIDELFAEATGYDDDDNER